MIETNSPADEKCVDTSDNAASENFYGFRLKSCNETLCPENKVGDSSPDRDILSAIEVGKSYEKGWIDIVIRFRPRSSMTEYQFVLHAVPNGVHEDLHFLDNIIDSEIDTRRDVPDVDSSSMFIRPRYIAECPENVIASGVPIPTWIWLEVANHRPNLFGDDVFFPHSCIEIGGAHAEREIHVATVTRDKLTDSGECCLVERMPNVTNAGVDEFANLVRRLRSEGDLVHVLVDFRVKLNNGSVWLTVKESAAKAFDFLCIFPSPGDQALRTLEGVLGIHAPSPGAQS